DEITEWSRIDTVNGGPTPSCSEWSTFNSDWSASVHRAQSTPRGPPSLTVCPSVASNKGGDRVLITGGWFVRGHEYSVVFGEKRVMASLIQDGVIQVITPPAPGKGKVSIRVLSDERQIGSTLDFFYKSCAREGPSRFDLLQALVDRVYLVCAAFNSEVNIHEVDDDCILSVIDSMRGRKIKFPSLLNSSIRSRTILHLAAALDFHELLQLVLYRRQDFPASYREFDINAKDLGGETPLTIALANRKGRCAMILANDAGWSMDDLERETERLRSESASMRGTLSIMDDDVSCHREEDDEMTDGHARNTEAWVMSHGETIMEGREGMRAEDMGRLPLEISMDTEVLVPDSPTMANLFQAVTSPGMVNDYARDQMATLTRRLIDALPTNVKMTNGVMDVLPHPHPHPIPHSHLVYTECPPMNHNPSTMSNGATDYQNDHCMAVNYGHTMNDGQDFGFYMDANAFYPMVASTSTADHMSIGSLDVELEDRDLGDFLSGSNEIAVDVDPLQKKLETLKLNPKEQRDVYEAALVMQRSSFGGSSPTENERNAAMTIQTCYRRYKQYCYLRRLHNAAVVVQKHFRLRRANQKEETHDQVQEHPSMQGESICIQVPNRSLSREHQAAATIQNAYRGHRKRQAAARLIQKFMRQTRQNPPNDELSLNAEEARSKRRCVYGWDNKSPLSGSDMHISPRW
ncbi:hypothetical protein PFISCL1PPCAC_8066, partial [Pristionchus fissidentatus]